MKKLILIAATILISLIQIQCKKDNVSGPPNTSNPTIADNIISLQDKSDDLLSNLLASKDTVSALDSVLKVILKDSTVASGDVSSQGISIQYKNGVKGGIMIDPDDGYPLLYKSINKNAPFTPADIKDFSPSSKKTIFINPSYAERKTWADPVVTLYNNIFPKNAYNPPDIYLDAAATVDLFTNLAGYGIIHIYSHGYAWPKKWALTEVYLMTGEDINAVTTKKYENQILGGNIPLIKIAKKSTKYWISPSFFSSMNNFEKDSTIVYGGFCFGFLGGWPNAVLDVSKAGAYTGFTWRVNTAWNAFLASSLFDTLSNNSVKIPRDLDYWFTQTPSIAKKRWDSGDLVWCKIQYAGHSELTLWSSLTINISPSPANATPNESITFTAKATGKLPSQAKYKWNFGDGSAEQIIVNDSTVTHTYINEGTFTITVKLLDQADKQLSTASSQAIITTAIVTPKFVEARVDIKPGYSAENWTIEGKYETETLPHTLRDTSYSGTDTVGASYSNSCPITMSGNSFSGSVVIIDTVGAEQGITNLSINGSINPVTKTASATISSSSSGTAVYNTYTVTSSISCSANGVPVNYMKSDIYYFKITGFAACSYITSYTHSYVMAPIPPLGVTKSGLKLTRNSSAYWCYSGSEVSITLTIY